MSDELVTRAMYDGAIDRAHDAHQRQLAAEHDRDRLAAQLARQQVEIEAGRRIIEQSHAHLTAALMPPPGETVKFIDRVQAAYLLLRGEKEGPIMSREVPS